MSQNDICRNAGGSRLQAY